MAGDPEARELDCRGLLCPQPVIQTKEVLAAMAGGRLQVLVDNEAARSNVTRFARSQGLAVDEREENGVFRLTIEQAAVAGSSSGSRAKAEAAASEEYLCYPVGGGVVAIIAADTMGRGDEELGRVLMRAFIKTLPALDPLPGALYFYNAGVRITAGADPDEGLLDPLRELVRRGSRVYSCGTCLDFFGLQEKLRVGEVTNMYEIMKGMAEAQTVIRP